MTHIFISESDAAQKLGFKERTLRRKVLGTGAYQTRETLPITFTAVGKGYRYSLDDINKLLRKSSSSK